MDCYINKVSCFAKSGTGNIFTIANSAANRYVLFDLSNGTISEESGLAGSIEDLNGWYRWYSISNNRNWYIFIRNNSSK